MCTPVFLTQRHADFCCEVGLFNTYTLGGPLVDISGTAASCFQLGWLLWSEWEGSCLASAVCLSRVSVSHSGMSHSQWRHSISLPSPPLPFTLCGFPSMPFCSVWTSCLLSLSLWSSYRRSVCLLMACVSLCVAAHIRIPCRLVLWHHSVPSMLLTWNQTPTDRQTMDTRQQDGAGRTNLRECVWVFFFFFNVMVVMVTWLPHNHGNHPQSSER